MSVILREPAVVDQGPIRSRRGIVWQSIRRRPSGERDVV